MTKSSWDLEAIGLGFEGYEANFVRKDSSMESWMQEAKGPSLMRPSRTKPSQMVTATSKTSISGFEAIGFGDYGPPKGAG